MVGVTSLTNQLFVLRGDAQEIEVYDTSTFQLQRSITVANLEGPLALTSCAFYNCLYASSFKQRSKLWECGYVHRVDLFDNVTVRCWDVGKKPSGLFVNSANNVVVTCCDEHKIKEYTTLGTVVREINLKHSGITDPSHAVQLPNDQFAVCHPHRVCVIDANGAILHSYGTTTRGLGAGQLDTPKSLMQIRNGCLLVGNNDKFCILRLNPVCSDAQVVALPTDSGLMSPLGFFFDELRGRLYVADNYGRRVIVFDNVYFNEMN